MWIKDTFLLVFFYLFLIYGNYYCNDTYSNFIIYLFHMRLFLPANLRGNKSDQCRNWEDIYFTRTFYYLLPSSKYHSYNGTLKVNVMYEVYCTWTWHMICGILFIYFPFVFFFFLVLRVRAKVLYQDLFVVPWLVLQILSQRLTLIRLDLDLILTCT